MAERIYIYPKRLKLITPEAGERLGIPAEVPFFVSPDITKAENCFDCGIEYTPLVYQVGYTIAAQHIHDKFPEMKGGIYFHTNRTYLSFEFPFNNEQFDGWVANVIPQGRVWSALGGTGAAEQVFITGMRALCMGHMPREAIMGGYLIGHGELLLPICWQAARDYKPKFSFEITDTGEALFSEV